MHLTIAVLICYLWQVFDSIHNNLEFAVIAAAFAMYGSKKKIVIPDIKLLLLITGAHTFICLTAGTLSMVNFVIQLSSVMLSYLYFYNVVKSYSMEKVLRRYCIVSFGFAVFGLFQEIFAVFGNYTLVQLHFLVKGMKLVPVYGSLIRIEGLCTEPFNFTLLLLPAVYCAMRTLMFKDFRIYGKIQAIVVLLAYVLTFSGAGMIGLGIVVMLALSDRKHKKAKENIGISFIRGGVIVIIIATAFIWAYVNVPTIKERVDDTLGVFRGIVDLENANMSTYAIASNLHVARNELISTLGIGVGFGSYGANYFRYSYGLDSTFYAFGINQLDGSGLIIRFMGEMGVLGLSFLVYFFVKYRRRVRPEEKWISNAMLAQLLLRCIRLGNYTMFGMGFIVCVYALVGSREYSTKRERQIIGDLMSEDLGRKQREYS